MKREQIEFELEEEEYEQAQKNAKEEGLTVEEYIYNLLTQASS